jgi:hypothetical protein
MWATDAFSVVHISPTTSLTHLSPENLNQLLFKFFSKIVSICLTHSVIFLELPYHHAKSAPFGCLSRVSSDVETQEIEPLVQMSGLGFLR